MKKLIALIVLLFSLNAYAASQDVSSTTAASIIDDVEVILNDSNNRMWSPGSLLQWLNDGMLAIATRSYCLEATESIDLATDTLEYSVTSDYITIVAVLYTDSDGDTYALRKGSPMSVGIIDDPGESVYWYDWGGKIGVYPTITRTTETITAYYITRPTAIISSANVTTPAIYDIALTHYITAQAWLRDRTYAKYVQAMALYNAELDRLRQDLNSFPKRPIDE